MVMQMMATPQLPNHPWKRLSSQFIGTLRNTSQPYAMISLMAG